VATGSLSPPQTFRLPKPPSGDSAAARQMAVALRDAADEVIAAQYQAHRVLEDAWQSWTGCSARAMHHPLAELDARTRRVATALCEAADRLDHYAVVLEKAHKQHHWSWGKVLTVAAVVAVTATVVIVTVGAAAPAAAAVDGALVGAEVAATTSAVGAASAAAVEAAEAVTIAVRALQALRAVATFLRPQIFVTAGLTDYEAFRQVQATGRLDLTALAEHAGTNVVAGTAGTRLAGALGGLGAEAANPVVQWALPRLAVSAGWGATAAGEQYLMTGDVDPWRVAQASGMAFAGTVAQDLLPQIIGRNGAAVGITSDPTAERALRDALRLKASLAQMAQRDLREIRFRTGLNDGRRLAREHPGTRPEEWEKVASRRYVDGTGDYDLFEVHSYRNARTGMVVEPKTKFQRLGDEYKLARRHGVGPGRGSWETWQALKATLWTDSTHGGR
jgi:hypothetical protein